MIETLFALTVLLLIICFVFLTDMNKKQKDILKRLSALENPGAAPASESNPSPAVPKAVPAVPEEPVVTTAQADQPEPARVWKPRIFAFFSSPVFKDAVNRFLENWIAIVAIMILVAGVSYFGIWASSRVSPGLRFGFITVFALVLFGSAFLLRDKDGFASLARWLRSGSGAVFLFATLGAGGIPGLQWIYNPLFALGFLLTGIAANLLLSFYAKNDYFSGLHILLSLIALSIAPQNAVTLFVAAVVTLAGFSLQMKRKADIHHLITLFAFFLFVFYWGFKADMSVAFYNMSALGVVYATGCMSLLLHYRKVYADRDFDLLPFVNHLLNWLFVAVATVRFAPGFRYVSIPLFVFALALFALSRYGKKLNIRWLYLSDTMIAQIVAVLSFLFLLRVDMNVISVFFIVLAETVIFHRIIRLEGTLPLAAFGSFLVMSAAAAICVFALKADISSVGYDRQIAVFILYASVGLTGYFLSSASRHAIGHANAGEPAVTLRIYAVTVTVAGFISLLAAFAVFFVSVDYELLPDNLNPELLSLIPFVFLLWIRYRLAVMNAAGPGSVSTIGMTIGIYAYLTIIGLFTVFSALSDRPDAPALTGIYFSSGYVGAVSLAFFSVFNKEKRKRFSLNPGVILFVFYLVISAYVAFAESASLAVSLFWMLVSLAASFVGRMDFASKNPVEKHFPGHTDVMRKTILLSGIACLPLFLLRIVFVDSNSAYLFAGWLPVRYLVEALSVGVVLVWLLGQKPGRAGLVSEKLVLHFLELITAIAVVLLFLETDRTAFPLALSIFAVALLFMGLGLRRSRAGFSRFILHSLFVGWLACIALIFSYGPAYSPGLRFGDQPWFLAAGSMFLLFGHVYLLHRFFSTDNLVFGEGFGVQERMALFFLRRKNLFAFYPVFIALAFFFAWSFRQSFLTVLLCTEVFCVFALSIALRENHFRYLSMAGLAGCLVRLVLFDLVHMPTLTKALVCIFVALLMLGMNVLYNRFGKAADGQNEIKP